jgi:tungstate transport system substrate-binding protein
MIASLLFAYRSAAWIVAALLVLLACGRPSDRDGELVLASTTSTDDSGLFDELLPAFERAHPGVRVRLIAVGSGQALELGGRGDADVLLVHAPEAEEAFMESGAGRTRTPVMYNDYVLAGPATDPAAVRSALGATDAFARIAAHGAPFVSRGDDSGTHHRELSLWRAGGVTPGPDASFRAEVGQGMGETLMIASERQAYVLTDRGTWTALAGTLRLAVLFEGGEELLNMYSVITVTAARNPAAAGQFADWITSEAGAAVIGGYGATRFGAPLFTPVSRAGTRQGARD